MGGIHLVCGTGWLGGGGGKKGSPTVGRTSVRGHTNSSIWTSGGVLNQVGMGWGWYGVGVYWSPVEVSIVR